MKIIADTNLLARAAVQDDPEQAALAEATLRDADSIAITLPTLCEFVWVLMRGYKKTPSQTAAAMRRLLSSATVAADRPAADVGLTILEAGGDFADGVIAFEGRRLGGEVFVTFDRKAASLIEETGTKTQLLSRT
ncbi:type II toxin-antitoxin system VapC family toxin [Inquilinus sp. NPDC058860]|uniref:type II toxin-antitoxin system VapC family toxin n=1 Tax=Inquilinus sp. NPDC058860 TaxID=3346652 RepID=UPI0036867BC7